MYTYEILESVANYNVNKKKYADLLIKESIRLKSCKIYNS